MKEKICTLIGMMGSAIASIFGGFDFGLQTLCVFMAIDVITGGFILPAIFKKSPKSANGALESNAFGKGICRKGECLLIVLIAYRLDILIGTKYIRDGVIIAFIANELISITENAGLMGVPLPDVMKSAIDILSTKADESKKQEKIGE